MHEENTFTIYFLEPPMPSILHRLKNSSNKLAYVYVQFLGEDRKKIDLDECLLRELVDLFLRIQFTFWEAINQTTNAKFPGRVQISVIKQVEDFIDNDEDGFVRLFGEYIPYFIFLSHIKSWDCTQKEPHLKPREHYSDHLAVLRHKKKSGSYRLVYTEVKTTKANAYNLVKYKIFPEFKSIENETRDRDLLSDIKKLDWYFLESRQEVRNVVESLFWKNNIYFQALVVSTECDPSVFKGYEDVVGVHLKKATKRRRALVVPIENWDKWVETIKDLVKAQLQKVKTTGKI